MARDPSTSSAAPTPPPAGDRPWLDALIEAIDKPLRRYGGIGEYTLSPDCLLRMAIVRNDCELALQDGVRLRPGDRVVNLHFWNERVPLIAAAGPTLGWARRLHEGFEASLRQLARHFAATPGLDDIAAIRLDAAFGAAKRSRRISSILSRFGFEIVPEHDSQSLAKKLRRYGENILISFIVLARNPIALHSDTLIRRRVVAYLSRRALENRYGAAVRRENQTSQSRLYW